VVYRTYATFDAPGDCPINAVASTLSINLFARAGFPFYQDPLGNNLPPNAALFPRFPTLQFDTFDTIGVADNSGDGAFLLANWGCFP